MVRIISFLLCFCWAAHPGLAQPGWEAGGWAAGGYYFGDLNTSFDLGLPGWAAGGAGRYLFNERVALKGSLSVGYFRADDALSTNAFERARNLSFRTEYTEAALQVEFNFLPYEHGNYEKYFTPYLLAGVSGLYFRPRAHYEGDWVALRPLGTEGQPEGDEYSPFTGALLVGGGLKFDLSYRWSLNLELGSRIAFSDYLDDVSTVYPDKARLAAERGDLAVALSDRSGEVNPEDLPPNVDFSDIGQTGKQRGESSNADNFLLLKVGFMYYFGQIHCPEVGAGKP